MYVRVETVLGLILFLSAVAVAGEPPAEGSPNAQTVVETPVSTNPLEGSDSAPAETGVDTSVGPPAAGPSELAKPAATTDAASRCRGGFANPSGRRTRGS